MDRFTTDSPASFSRNFFSSVYDRDGAERAYFIAMDVDSRPHCENCDEAHELLIWVEYAKFFWCPVCLLEQMEYLESLLTQPACECRQTAVDDCNPEGCAAHDPASEWNQSWHEFSREYSALKQLAIEHNLDWKREKGTPRKSAAIARNIPAGVQGVA